MALLSLSTSPSPSPSPSTSPSLSPSCRLDRSLPRPTDTGLFPASILWVKVRLINAKRPPLVPCIKCKKTDKNKHTPEEISVERYPYDSYMDPTSGRLEPASGARASIPGPDLWPEGTASRVRAASAPAPTGVSTGTPSYGKTPGSRRMRYKSSVDAVKSTETGVNSDDANVCTEMSTTSDDAAEGETLYDESEQPKEESSEFVVYQEPETKELTDYDLDKELGRPHPFINPHTKRSLEEPLTSEELWWHWRKPEKERWSRWQKRRPDVETVFLKAMAETGQIKLYGDHPTMTECALYRARRHLYKEERLEAERERLEREGPLAYYSEWVSAWKRDTSREAVQKHFEETGEDENLQLIEMFTYQTDREYRIMRGTDKRVPRDPLAMRMREGLIKQIWGGDPVYPTINYIRDPDEVTDFRGPNFHEPTPNMVAYLKERGLVISEEEFNELQEKDSDQELEVDDMDDAMAQAVDIGENDDEFADDEIDGEEEKLNRNWKSKGKPKKTDLSLEEAIDDSENLTDFLLDFDDGDDL